MILFDYLYYLIFKFYSDFNEKGAAPSSAGIIGGFQSMNFLTGMMLFQLVFRQNANINKLVVLVMAIAFQVFTYYRYIYKERPAIDVLEKKWLSKTAVSRKQISTTLFLYGSASIITCFGLAIYLGSRHAS
jgi:hypothetical protein